MTESPGRSLSRRSVIKALIGVGGAAAALSAFGWINRDALLDYARDALIAKPGPLQDGTRDSLIAVIESLFPYPVETSHYAASFDWRAENEPGRKAYYERFATQLNRTARKQGASSFIDAASETRKRVLDEVFMPSVSHPPADVSIQSTSTFISSLSDDDLNKALFTTLILQPAFNIFMDTDAFIVLGFEKWPGRPGGLDTYTNPPPGAE